MNLLLPLALLDSTREDLTKFMNRRLKGAEFLGGVQETHCGPGEEAVWPPGSHLECSGEL